MDTSHKKHTTSFKSIFLLQFFFFKNKNTCNIYFTPLGIAGFWFFHAHFDSR